MTGEIESTFPATLTRVGEDSEEARQLARARAGDQAAIRWLITRYRQRAVRLATSILRRSDEAEDVAQEAFVRAFRNLHAFRGDGHFYTWLYHIVVHLCRDRQRIRRWNSEEPIDLDELRAGAAHLSAEDIENHVLVEMLLDRLSPAMRAMLVLRELEGLEYEEIARVLEIPIGRVKWRLHEARARFRVLWQEAMREVDNV